MSTGTRSESLCTSATGLRVAAVHARRNADLVGYGIKHGQAPLFVDRATVGSHGTLWELRDLAGELGTRALSVAGRRGQPFGIPDVDAAVADYDERIPGIA